MFECENGELLPAGVPAAPLATDNSLLTKIITDDELLVIQQMAAGLNMLKADLDSAASRAESLLETDYDLDKKEDYDQFVKNFGKGCPLSKAITGIDSKRKELNKFSAALVNTKIGAVLEKETLLLKRGTDIRREHDEKVAAIEAAKRAEETARVERINAEIERMTARTDVLVRLPGTMIGKDSVAIKAAIADASTNFQFREETFFDEFIGAAREKRSALLGEQMACLHSLQTLLASAEADERAKAERAEAERAEAERKRVADEAAEAGRIRQQQELAEANKINEILMSSIRLANSPPAGIRAEIEKISALTGSPKLLDVVSAVVESLQAALAAAERREVEGGEKSKAAEAARLKAAEEEWVKREAVAAAEEAAKEEAAKKAAEEAEEKRKAKEAEAKREAEEREDADLEKTINALWDFTIDRGTAEKLLTAVLSGEIPHLSWSNKC